MKRFNDFYAKPEYKIYCGCVYILRGFYQPNLLVENKLILPARGLNLEGDRSPPALNLCFTLWLQDWSHCPKSEKPLRGLWTTQLSSKAFQKLKLKLETKSLL
jgi:hypothetical protein